MRKQEDTRLAEMAAEKAHFEAIQANADIVRDFAFTHTTYLSSLMCGFHFILSTNFIWVDMFEVRQLAVLI